MTDAGAIVFIVDDDASVRESIKNLIRSVGRQVESFTPAQEFLRAHGMNPDASCSMYECPASVDWIDRSG